MHKLVQYILVLGFLLSVSLSASSFKYDVVIFKATKKYWSDFNEPLYWKAQIKAESAFNPYAVSPVGAQGLAQFMPLTKKQIWNEMGYNSLIPSFSPYHSINAGAYYMRKLRNSWNWKRPTIDKHRLAQASYNGGIGNIIKSQKKCNNVLLYEDIIKCLPQITGRHSTETINYVKKIEKYYKEYKLGD